MSARLSADRFGGKDYLRFAKSEADAKAAFSAMLSERLKGQPHVVYVASEPDQLDLLPRGSFRVLVTAELPAIKQRFAARMGGRLPAPVEAMLERRHGSFDALPHELHIHSADMTAAKAAERILGAMPS